MTLDQLKTLCAIVEQGSFRAAAESLLRTRSAVSASIKNLEESLGFKIFSRENYRPELTKMGRAFYEKARGVLEDANDLAAFGHHLAEGCEPEIHLGVSLAVPLDGIMEALKELTAYSPSTTLYFSSGTPDMIREKLLNRELDAAITGTVEDAAELEQVFLTTVEFLPVISPRSPLSDECHQLKLSEPGKMPQVLEDGADIPEAEDYSLFSIQPLSFLKNATNPMIIKSLLKSGLAWGIAPRHLIRQELETGQLLEIESKDFPPNKLSISLMRRKDAYMGKAAHKIWQLFQEIDWSQIRE